MTQTLAGLKKQAAAIKQARKADVWKEQVVDLNASLQKAKLTQRAANARAERAEAETRQAYCERETWKRRALAAEAKLKSLGALS